MRFSWLLCAKREKRKESPSASILRREGVVTHMRRAEDGRVPVGHHHIVAISKTVRTSIFGVMAAGAAVIM